MDRDYAKYLLAKVKSDYDVIADDFSGSREDVWEETGFLLEDYLKDGDRVLDLGCGNGRYFPLFRKRSVEYHGVDNSKKLIEIAKDKYPGADFLIADAFDLPFPADFFDKVYSIAVFHHIPSRELRVAFLKEARRVLKVGGSLTLTVWKFHKLEARCLLFKYTILKLIGKSKLGWKDILEPWDNKAERYYHWFSGKELNGLAKKAGFKIKKSGLILNKKGNRRNIYLVAEK